MLSSEEKTRIIADSAIEKLGTDVVSIDVAKQFGIIDYFVIITAKNAKQVSSIADEIELNLHKYKLKRKQIEKTEENDWLLIDYDDVIIHIMQPNYREFYAIEKLWKDCPIIEFKND